MNIIRELRKKEGLSQQELASLCRVHQTAVSQWENGRTAPDLESLKMLSDIFGVSVEKLIGAEMPADENRIPGFSSISAAGAAELIGESKMFALKVAGEDMLPTLCPGDTVIVSRSAEIENGDIVAVTVGSSNAYIKRIIKKDTSVLLVSENPVFEPLIFNYDEVNALPMCILGRVTEMRRKL